jgi:hypothetical protein
MAARIQRSTVLVGKSTSIAVLSLHDSQINACVSNMDTPSGFSGTGSRHDGDIHADDRETRVRFHGTY